MISVADIWFHWLWARFCWVISLKKVLFSNKFVHQTKQKFLHWWIQYWLQNWMQKWIQKWITGCFDWNLKNNSSKSWLENAQYGRQCCARRFDFVTSIIPLCLLVSLMVHLKLFCFGRYFKKYSVKFSHCSNNQTAANFNDNHLVLQCFFAYFPTTSVI